MEEENNKLKMKSKDLIKENIKKIEEIFPGVVVESSKGKAIDFEALKQELTNHVIEGNKERYQLTWPGKREAIVIANIPTTKTLRPQKEKSLNFENTKNIYIEGDNLEALKILQESYLHKIKCIYIDPPYNTGRNLIYRNDFSKQVENELYDSDQIDEIGQRLVANIQTDGKFHSIWLSMMYERIKLSRNLLDDDGIIIMAIDDNEYPNLVKIADEIYGERNYVGTIVTRCNPQGRGKINIDPTHEYHIIYAKEIENMPQLFLNRKYKDQYTNLIRGGNNSRKNERPRRFYPMLVKDNKIEIIKREEYIKIYDDKKGFNEEYIKELTKKYEKEGYQVIWPINTKGEEKVWQRQYDRVAKEYQTYIYQGGQIKTQATEGKTPMSVWSEDIHSNVAYGTNQLNKLFDNDKVFDYSKSIATVKDLISLGENDIVLDFFSGSATTAQAVMSLNAEDNGDRRFIMIQVQEECPDYLDAKKNGFNVICDVGEERIRRAGKKIKEETGADIDYGFRVFRIDSSNMKDVYYAPNDLKQSQLNLFETNIKEDRTADDLLIQVMLDLGITLDLEIKERKILENNVYFVDENYLVACFDDKIDINIISEICKIDPLKIVFKENSFKEDSDKINIFERIKKLSPETEINII